MEDHGHDGAELNGWITLRLTRTASHRCVTRRLLYSRCLSSRSFSLLADMASIPRKKMPQRPMAQQKFTQKLPIPISVAFCLLVYYISKFNAYSYLET